MVVQGQDLFSPAFSKTPRFSTVPGHDAASKTSGVPACLALARSCCTAGERVKTSRKSEQPLQYFTVSCRSVLDNFTETTI